MKRILLLLLFPVVLFSQTNVDKLVSQLDLLSEASFDNWHYTTNLTLKAEDISKPTFDDSQWKVSALNENLIIDSCWFRKVIEVPKYVAGVPVHGSVKFLTSIDDYGYMWINGEAKGKFPWDGEFLLGNDVKPGDKFVIVIKAINTGGPLRIIRAKLNIANETSVQALVKNLSLSLRVGQKLLSFDTYQTNAHVKVDPGIDKSIFKKEEKEKLQKLLQETALRVNIDALANGDTVQFIKSVDEIKKDLKPVSEFAKNFTLQFAANAHIDAAWLWRKKETEEVCKRTFSAVMNMFKARTDFTYTQSAAAYYEWMQKDYPDLFAQIKEKVNEGRWEIAGGMWVEPDCNLPSGDSWMRQLLYAQDYFQNNLGKRAKIGWNPDSFGYNWNLPQFMLKGGLDAFITQKIGWNDTNVFPYRVFWWESPDGSKILTYFPFDYVNEIDNPFGLVDWQRQFEANTGFKKMLVLFGVGDHGGGPSIAMMKRIDQLKDLIIYPKIEFGTAENYLNWLRKQDLAGVPTWDNELYLEYHRGTATTQANTKEWNRKSEVLLTDAEKFSSLASLVKPNDYKANLRDAWKKVLFNQFHDILPGSGIREIYLDADKDYRAASELGNFVLKSSLKELSSDINTSSITTGKPIIVYNPLSWERSDVATIKLPEGDKNDYYVSDTNGNEIPSQVVWLDQLNKEIIFVADKVPALGFKTYILHAGLNEKQQTSFLQTSVTQKDNNEETIENGLFKVAVDLNNGWVKSIYDKTLNKEILNGYGNKLEILEDLPKAWDAWNIGLTGKEFPSKFRKAEVVEDGPVRVVLRLYRDYLKPGVVKEFPTEDFPNTFFTQDIILYHGIDRIDFKTDVEWWEDKTMLKVAFPFNVEDTVATYEIPFGSIKRSTTLKAQLDKGKWEVNAQKWADLSNNDFGISLMNKTKYGYDTKGNVMRLSLLRSPKWPDPTADRGDHTIEYSLYPHKGRVEQSQTVEKGYEYNYPLLTSISSAHPGKFDLEHSFLQLNNSNVIITSIKHAENSNAWVVTMYESKGKDTNTTLTLPFAPKKVVESNFLEEDGKTINSAGNKINFQVGKNKTEVIKISF